MGKNTKGGKKFKKGKKNTSPIKKAVVLKEEMQEYAKVIKILGDCRVDLECNDGKKRIGHIAGRLRKRVWIRNNDLVLISLRDYQPEKCDVIHKYSESDKNYLVNKGHLKKIEDEEENNNSIQFTNDPLENEEDEDDNECAFNFDEI